MVKELKGGYTTGACAAAGAKACLLYLAGEYCGEVDIIALDGTPLHIPVKEVVAGENGATAEIVKFSGDDPDITNGASVFTTVELRAYDGPQGLEPLLSEDIRQIGGQRISFAAGEGIGHATKPGMSVPPGEPAINPGPRRLIVQEVLPLLQDNQGLTVTISIPAGKELCRRTLNPILGIEGGISVIGTTGVLRPMSEEAFKNSLVPQIDVAKAAGFSSLVYVPGKIGENIALKNGLPAAAMVQTSNFIGFMLEAAADRDIANVLLFGHIGKLAKVAGGTFHTHNRMGDGRLEVLAAYAGATGLDAAGMQKILAAVTTEEAIQVIDEAGLTHVYTTIAQRASQRSMRYVFNRCRVGTVIVTLKGRLLGMDENAKAIMELLRK